MTGRAVAFALLLLAVFLVEGVIAPAVAVAGRGPDLAVLVVAGFALTQGPAAGARLGFVVGLARDLLGSGAGLLGSWALAFVLVGHLAGIARPYVPGSTGSRGRAAGFPTTSGSGTTVGGHIVVGAVASLVATAVAGLFPLALTPDDDLRGFAVRMVVALGWGAVLGPVLCRSAQALAARTSAGPSVS